MLNVQVNNEKGRYLKWYTSQCNRKPSFGKIISSISIESEQDMFYLYLVKITVVNGIYKEDHTKGEEIFVEGYDVATFYNSKEDYLKAKKEVLDEAGFN